jgi:long-chain acyl-CoA synthetase
VIGEVSLQAGRTVEISGLLAYAAERLSPYKIPSRVVIVPAIPLTNTGKVIRAA